MVMLKIVSSYQRYMQMLWPIWFRLMGESRPLNVMCKSTLRAFARFVHTDNVYLDILYRTDEDPVCDNIIVLRRRYSRALLEQCDWRLCLTALCGPRQRLFTQSDVHLLSSNSQQRRFNRNHLVNAIKSNASCAA